MNRIRENKGARTGVFFGATSGVITTIGLITELYGGTESRVAVLGGILYESIGARSAGYRESASIPGRFLPVFKLEIDKGK